jgi:predicted glycoside hydrolase/deacetylase ChbG (UPF0249 family)
MKLYSDDFGYNKKVDKGIIKLIRRNKLFGASVLSTMATPRSLRWLAYTLDKKRNFILGLHINLIEGTPAEHFLRIRTLVDREGKFFPLLILVYKLFFGLVSKSQIKAEIEAQLLNLKNKGFRIKMLDSHQHTHSISPVAEIVVDLARKYDIPYIRSFNTIQNYSFKAKLTYAFIKIVAFLSYFAAYKKVGMPASWRSKKDFNWTVMSWESNTFDIDEAVKRKSTFVIHPYLPFDTNKSYRSFIK